MLNVGVAMVVKAISIFFPDERQVLVFLRKAEQDGSFASLQAFDAHAGGSVLSRRKGCLPMAQKKCTAPVRE